MSEAWIVNASPLILLSRMGAAIHAADRSYAKITPPARRRVVSQRRLVSLPSRWRAPHRVLNGLAAEYDRHTVSESPSRERRITHSRVVAPRPQRVDRRHLFKLMCPSNDPDSDDV